MLFLGEEIRGQWQATPGQDRYQTMVAEGTDQAIERHRRDVTDHRTQLQTQAPMRRQQGIAGDLWSHLPIAQDEVGQDGEHGTTRGALDAPDADATQANPDVMGVAGEAPSAATARLVIELKAQGHEESEDTFEKRLAIAQEAKVGGFVLKINGDSAVVSCPCGCCAQAVTPRVSGLVS